jgi:hypothetical protein
MFDTLEKWRIAAAEWLDLQEAADILRETKNDVLAEMTALAQGSSHAEKDRNARMSDEWKEFRAKMLDAEAKARRSRLRLKYHDMKFNAERSANANARAERNHG